MGENEKWQTLTLFEVVPLKRKGLRLKITL